MFLDLGGEGHNRFYSFSESLRVLFWSVFDPGHPEVVGCSEGISRDASLVLWFIYNGIVVIVLLNLLIALMNVATNAVVEDRISSWKYHRTHLWMDYCNKAVVLPPPFNLLGIIVDVVMMLACR